MTAASASFGPKKNNTSESMRGADLQASKCLHAAVRVGDLQALEASFERGADPNGENEYGITPLMAAVARPGCPRSLVERLLVYGADPDVGSVPLCFFVADEGLRAWFAATSDHITRYHYFEAFPLPLLKKCLGNGSFTLSRRARRGRTPLELARQSSTEQAGILRQASRGLCQENAHLWPPFCRARAAQLARIFAQLLKAFPGDGGALRDPLYDEVLPRCIGGRVAVEQWRMTVLAATFLVRLRRWSKLNHDNGRPRA